MQAIISQSVSRDHGEKWGGGGRSNLDQSHQALWLGSMINVSGGNMKSNPGSLTISRTGTVPFHNAPPYVTQRSGALLCPDCVRPVVGSNYERPFYSLSSSISTSCYFILRFRHLSEVTIELFFTAKHFLTKIFIFGSRTRDQMVCY